LLQALSLHKNFILFYFFARQCLNYPIVVSFKITPTKTCNLHITHKGEFMSVEYRIALAVADVP